MDIKNYIQQLQSEYISKNRENNKKKIWITNWAIIYIGTTINSAV